MANKILVIEDDPQILDHTLQVLELEGFETIGAEDGRVGLQYATMYLPNLIISDIRMPELDGYQVLAQLRQNPLTATIPFIFLTAQSNRADVRQGMDLGADDYVTKPFTVAELLTAVHARLERHAIFIREQEQKLNELRGDLSHILPHELRTPLNVIMGYADFIATNADSLTMEKIMPMIQTIQNGSRRLHHLIENYLLYAQLELLKTETQYAFQPDRDSMAHPDDIVANLAKNTARQAERTADLNLDLTTDGEIQISDSSFHKIVEELIDNAFKFSTDGSPVFIQTAVDADTYTLRITDNGRGMTPEQIEAIGPFRQFRRRVYEQQGSGLGLAIARTLVELYGGAFTVESAPDQGTTVMVTLKRNPAPDTA